MNNTCIITLMRKGSKRLNNKCMLELNGKPLFYYTVKFAIQLGYDYYLCHDYDELNLEKYFDINELNKIKIIKRNLQFTGDTHRTNEEIKSFNLDYENYVFLQATNPIRSSVGYYKHIINEFTNKNNVRYHCGFTAKEINKFVYNKDAASINFDDEYRTDNGCPKNNIYVENGNFYIFKKSMLESKHLLGNWWWVRKVYPENILVDIDTQEDLKEAEKYMEKLEWLK